ncbi:MAG TPA: hypothetical protein VN240_08300 [Propylenella sp.]|nr:hypothetical protein [Propylenella sp.]
MRKSVVAVLIAGLTLAACAADPGEPVGSATGATGAVVGSQFAPGQVPASAIGPLAGGLIGAEIGRSLDDADRQRALEAEYQVLEFGRAGQSVEWRSASSGNYGEVVVGPSYEVNLLDCRKFTHTVYIGGRARVARGTACRQPDATWRIIG